MIISVMPCIELEIEDDIDQAINDVLKTMRESGWNKALVKFNGFYLECMEGLTYEEILSDYKRMYLNNSDTCNKNTLVISGFPGIGKSVLFNDAKFSKYKILDSDSSKFSWIYKDGEKTEVRNPNFPKNYIEHIRDNMGKVDIILVSSHESVRNALHDANIPFILVYPEISAINDYTKRYMERGNDSDFIEFIIGSWKELIGKLNEETFAKNKLKLPKGKYLSDYIDRMVKFCPLINDHCDVVYTNADEYCGSACVKCKY